MTWASVAKRLDAYERLIRLDKPIGALLLLWPTLWAVWLASRGTPSAQVLLIFVMGTVVMRSAGCAINDYADRDLDPQVRRTAGRPLAAGRVTPREALMIAHTAAICVPPPSTTGFVFASSTARPATNGCIVSPKRDITSKTSLLSKASLFSALFTTSVFNVFTPGSDVLEAKAPSHSYPRSFVTAYAVVVPAGTHSLMIKYGASSSISFANLTPSLKSAFASTFAPSRIDSAG